MKSVVQSEKYGEIVYEESFWTGKKNVNINNQPLNKINKTTFQLPDGEQATVKGNFLYGSKLFIGQETITVTPPIKWYEIVLSLLPFLLIMVWGNVVALCEIVPVVGGAIGGAVSAMLSVLNVFFIKCVRPVWLKILITVAVTGVTFGICCGIGYAIIGIAT